MTSRDILHAIHRLDRLGPRRAMEQLEQREPDLAEHVLESLSQVHRQLLNAGLSARTTRSLYRRIERLTLQLLLTPPEVRKSGSPEATTPRVSNFAAPA